MKICTVCKEEKEISQFYKMRTTKDGLLPRCKTCQDSYHKDKRAKARVIREAEKVEELRLGLKTCTKCKEVKPFSDFFSADGVGGVRGDCKDCVNRLNRLRVAKDPAKKAALDKKYQSNPLVRKRLNAQARERYRTNEVVREKQLTSTKKAHCERMKTDTSFKLLVRLRIRLRETTKHVKNFRQFRNGRKSLLKELLGCTPDELRKHLESQFTKGMTWETYGLHGWHIDHIKPCAMFDLSNRKQLGECFHYTNLQPMWANENRSKGARFIG